MQLNSLPEVAQENYFNKLNPDFNDVAVIENNAELYAKASIPARKQADKYLELINLTKYMKHSGIIEILQDWNEKHPDKKSSYSALCKARIKYEQFGEYALLSKKGFKEEEYRVKPEYYKYYKVLYMKPSATSVIDCWVQTLNYAKQKDKIKTANFPCDKAFDRLIKKNTQQKK